MTPSEVLELWDAGEAVTPLERAVLLLERTWPSPAPFGDWTLGEVNAGLLRFRCAAWSAEWDCLTACPDCHETAEIRLEIPALLDGDPAAEGDAEPPGRLSGPRVRELLALHATGPVDGGRIAALLAASADASAAREDRLATISVGTTCPACGTSFRARMNVIQMVWTEFVARARVLLHEVAELASAFGWREADVLALPASRRARYLALVRGT
jgi:hypothetical protein